MNQPKPDVRYVGVPETLLEQMILTLRERPYKEVAAILVPVDFFGAVIPLPKQPTVVQTQPTDVPVPPVPGSAPSNPPAEE